MQDYWDRLDANRLSSTGRFAPSKDSQTRAPVVTRPQAVQKSASVQGYSQQHRRLVAQGPGLASTRKSNSKGQGGQHPRLINDGVEPYDDDVGTNSAGTEGTQNGGGYSEKYMAGKRGPARPAVARKSGIPRPSIVRRPMGTDSAYLEKDDERKLSGNVVHRNELPSQPRRPPPSTSVADSFKEPTYRHLNGEETIAQGYRDHYLPYNEEQEEEQDQDYEEEWYDDEWQGERPVEESAVPWSEPAAPERRLEQHQRGEQGHITHYKGNTEARPIPAPAVPTAVRPTAGARPTPRRPSMTRHDERPSLPPRQSKDNGEERDLRTETPETIIGKDTRVRGDVVVTGLLRVDGQLDGDQVSANAMLVTRGGTVQACVRGMECVFVEGTIVGDISATRIHLFKQGTVHGNLTCVSLQVEAGSMISGQANVGDMKLKQTSRV